MTVPIPAAYTDAPPIIREINLVLHLVAALRVSSTPERVRELQLRKAALLDRIALKTPDDTDAADVAGDAAIELMRQDHGPAEPTGGLTTTLLGIAARHYVRDQYAAYSNGLPTT
ncbi:hypothetical protein [Streptomyces sp. H39-S7]|uniref:hypothetical protein n=1 Tax=Streptomyces sp. H39-S7 TaxID=3004357 RepID=UPI0022AEEB56|nr:hypothetical protein [Streptomyces sp. H39-S7]MCZ4123897.1 hypothetical protein [Streptomyces sp. H39-S7]